MIGRIEGILLEKQPPFVLIDAHGVGYELQVSMHTFYHLPAEGEQVILYTQHIAREDASLLYGFLERREKTIFQHLIKISGIGPKTALAILSGLDPDELAECIIAQDVSRLSNTPGIGRKTAERLVIEMKDRLTHWENDGKSFVNTISMSKIDNNPIQDAITALIALGYKQPTARQMVAKIHRDGLSSEELIRLALKSVI